MDKVCCDAWLEGVKQINDAFTISTMHHGAPYSGKPFSYCPWCGINRTLTESPQKDSD